jgi:hypothetical protein
MRAAARAEWPMDSNASGMRARRSSARPRWCSLQSRSSSRCRRESRTETRSEWLASVTSESALPSASRRFATQSSGPQRRSTSHAERSSGSRRAFTRVRRWPSALEFRLPLGGFSAGKEPIPGCARRAWVGRARMRCADVDQSVELACWRCSANATRVVHRHNALSAETASHEKPFALLPSYCRDSEAFLAIVREYQRRGGATGAAIPPLNSARCGPRTCAMQHPGHVAATRG